MSADNRSRAVKTYVDEAQQAEWQAAADRLDMSQSEFVATMVQAGRREFGLEELDSNPGSSAPVDADPRGNALETVVLECLDDGAKDWDALSEHLEHELESAMQDLQSADRIRHSPREGGYVLQEDDDGH
jgi:hypothetical protein